MIPKPECFDCKIPYGEPGFPDLLIPNWAWNKIAPYGPGEGTEGGGGVLCPTCICRRLANAGIEKIPSAFVSGPLAYQPEDWIRHHRVTDLLTEDRADSADVTDAPKS